MIPSGVMRAMVPLPPVNQTLPSGPSAMSLGKPNVGSGNWVTVPSS
jgi:hypothetical protein